jgi:hypothetical protein
MYICTGIKNNSKMEYTTKQIENAKKRYNAMLIMRTIYDYDIETIGLEEAHRRCDYHNSIIREILGGNKAVEKEWKLFFLNDEAKKDQKKTESEEKKQANLNASADILAPIKQLRKTTAFGQWLNTYGNPYRSQHFSKKYTIEAVQSFLQTI